MSGNVHNLLSCFVRRQGMITQRHYPQIISAVRSKIRIALVNFLRQAVAFQC